jgi:hypothetical protein
MKSHKTFYNNQSEEDIVMSLIRLGYLKIQENQ